MSDFNMSDFEWYQFQCDRSTFSVTIEQPQADRILAVLEAARRWRLHGHEAHTDELNAAVDALLGAIGPGGGAK